MRYLWMSCSSWKLQPIMLANCKNQMWMGSWNVKFLWLPYPYATIFAPLWTNNRVKGSPYMYHTTKLDIQTPMYINHQPIKTDSIEGTTITLCVFEKAFRRHFLFDDALGWKNRYLWSRTCLLDVSNGKILKDIEGLFSILQKTWR